MPRSTRASTTRSQSNMALGTLALGAFVIGTAELVVIGILNLIAKDTRVSVSTAGQLVTAYALGIAVGAPILTALTTPVRPAPGAAPRARRVRRGKRPRGRRDELWDAADRAGADRVLSMVCSSESRR